MIVPSKIWAGDYNDIDKGGYWWADEFSNTDLSPYIRADIAKDLARALEMAKIWLDVDGRFDIQGINAALAKYNAALGEENT